MNPSAGCAGNILNMPLFSPVRISDSRLRQISGSGMRAQTNNWRVAVASRAVVFHKGSASLAQFSPAYNYYEQRNRLFVMKQYAPQNKSAFRSVQDVFIIVGRLLMAFVTLDKAKH